MPTTRKAAVSGRGVLDLKLPVSYPVRSKVSLCIAPNGALGSNCRWPPLTVTVASVPGIASGQGDADLSGRVGGSEHGALAHSPCLLEPYPNARLCQLQVFGAPLLFQVEGLKGCPMGMKLSIPLLDAWME